MGRKRHTGQGRDKGRSLPEQVPSQDGTQSLKHGHRPPPAPVTTSAGLYRHMDYTYRRLALTPDAPGCVGRGKALGLDAEIIDKALKFHSRGG